MNKNGEKLYRELTKVTESSMNVIWKCKYKTNPFPSCISLLSTVFCTVFILIGTMYTKFLIAAVTLGLVASEPTQIDLGSYGGGGGVLPGILKLLLKKSKVTVFVKDFNLKLTNFQFFYKLHFIKGGGGHHGPFGGSFVASAKYEGQAGGVAHKIADGDIPSHPSYITFGHGHYSDVLGASQGGGSLGGGGGGGGGGYKWGFVAPSSSGLGDHQGSA
ncbi:uncharacterized protein LOC123010176 [Tribolium madens]|uniref:uncharacterized protein LOC123010176 n=1 Tax=Tribolium madens TaxID=41895 RepID=UPI001CF75640|nr:uncharacterized protein LOC123010176 [Tribolium madens]